MIISIRRYDIFAIALRCYYVGFDAACCRHAQFLLHYAIFFFFFHTPPRCHAAFSLPVLYITP